MATKSKILFRITVWIFNSALFILISLLFYTTIPIKTTPTLLVPEGSVKTIITHLAKRGYALSQIDAYIVALLGKPQYGWISIGQTEINRIDFLHKLATSKAQMAEITLIPGETTTLFLRKLASELSLDLNKLQLYTDRYAEFEEAGFYADTYHVPMGIQEKHLILFLTSQSNKKYEALSIKIYGNYDKQRWNRLLSIASIIQKEAANSEEMPMVASVIYNRLKQNMPLQMDGTLNYGENSHTAITPEIIRQDNSKFNTYKNRGLPPSPVCSVSVDAIKAAIRPAQTNYLYFVKNAQGTHNFSETFEEHKSNIQSANPSK
jgi:UPF0755 protein